jgi:glycosyltransferase involved in cell wall biosynthesis
MPSGWHAWDIRPSWLNRLPLVKSHHQAFMPLYPSAFESLDLSGYDIVISNKSAFCHGVRVKEALHICYCLTPTRFIWNHEEYIEREKVPGWARLVLPFFVRRLRRWDAEAAKRVNHFVAISQEVRGRVKRFYQREAEVIYPPVDVEKFHPSDTQDDYFLVVSRLVPYKRIDIAIQALSNLRLPLIVVGEGRDRKRLERMSSPNIKFTGWLPDGEVATYVSHCRALIFPGREDFGIAPLEAMACGRPVIAYAAGGALETVIDGTMGILFKEQTPEALAEAVRGFGQTNFDPRIIRAHATKYDRHIFQSQIREFVERSWTEYKS